MFSIFSHQSNSNWTSTKIRPCRIDYYQENIKRHTDAAKGTENKEHKSALLPWKSIWTLLERKFKLGLRDGTVTEGTSCQSQQLESDPWAEGENQVPQVVIWLHTFVNNHVCLLHNCLAVSLPLQLPLGWLYQLQVNTQRNQSLRTPRIPAYSRLL